MSESRTGSQEGARASAPKGQQDQSHARSCVAAQRQSCLVWRNTSGTLITQAGNVAQVSDGSHTLRSDYYT